MNVLIQTARQILKSHPTKVKHITFIVKNINSNNPKILCYGLNNPNKTSPLAKKFGHRFASIHSELAAIKNFPFPLTKLGKYDILNLRVLVSGQISMAKPCRHCQKMLFAFGVKNIFYSDFNGKIQLEGLK